MEDDRRNDESLRGNEYSSLIFFETNQRRHRDLSCSAAHEQGECAALVDLLVDGWAGANDRTEWHGVVGFGCNRDHETEHFRFEQRLGRSTALANHIGHGDLALALRDHQVDHRALLGHLETRRSLANDRPIGNCRVIGVVDSAYAEASANEFVACVEQRERGDIGDWLQFALGVIGEGDGLRFAHDEAGGWLAEVDHALGLVGIDLGDANGAEAFVGEHLGCLIEGQTGDIGKSKRRGARIVAECLEQHECANGQQCNGNECGDAVPAAPRWWVVVDGLVRAGGVLALGHGLGARHE